MDLFGVAAVVTGGASGLGEATARSLGRAGARVAVLDRNLTRAQDIAAEIGGVAVECDIASAASAEAAVAVARKAHGPARVLVNCAGVAPAARIVGRGGPMNLDDFRNTVEVNLVGSVNLMRLVAADLATAPAVEDQERGVIILTASIAAYDGQIGQAAYAASKAGVVGLTLPAARELAASGIRVCTIAPGIFATPMMLAMPETVQQSLAATVPFPRRLGRPDEYALLVRAIIANPMLNGEVIRIDGALRMAPK